MTDDWFKSAIILAIIASLTFVLLYLFAIHLMAYVNLPLLAGVACIFTAIVAALRGDWLFTALFMTLTFIFFGLPAIGLAILILYALLYMLRRYWEGSCEYC